MNFTVSDTLNLENYLTTSVNRIVNSLIRISDYPPQENLFMQRFDAASKLAARKRQEARKRGEHVPAFLIASITSLCNLRCNGCYAQFLETHMDRAPIQQMSAENWERIFSEARSMGISFIVLAGGEPLLRWDVLEKAALYPEILFPVFTNGTLIAGKYLEFFDQFRNAVPILSIEGGRALTDARRGKGVYQHLHNTMRQMKTRRIFFGICVTLTMGNVDEVLSDSFLRQIEEEGVKAIVYIEYIPTNKGALRQVLDDKHRDLLKEKVAEIRNRSDAPLVLSFPGDEHDSMGCMAAGRGFFHINAHGDAEPCLFSPYSDMNVESHSLQEVMNSPLFCNLRTDGLMTKPHSGGCTLHRRRQQVREMLSSKTE